MFRTTVRAGILLALATVFSGCTGSDANRPQSVPVTGKVTYKGSGVGGALVTFAPASGKGPAAIGTTDPDGSFSLQAQGGGKGAVPGSYKVTVTKTETQGAQGAADEGPARIDGGAEPVKVVEHLPAKYKLPDTTPLKADVDAKAKNEFNFALEDNGGAQPAKKDAAEPAKKDAAPKGK